MNTDRHAVKSALISLGKEADYLHIHKAIDGDVPHIGKFCLHHLGVGQRIVDALFDHTTHVNSDGKLFLPRTIFHQHMVRDYENPPTFIDWLETFDTKLLPQYISDKELAKEIRVHPELRHLSINDKLRIEEVLGLRAFTHDEGIRAHPGRFCTFGHTSGIMPMTSLLGSRMGKMWTVDVLLTYLNLKFGRIPMLGDYEKCIIPQPWMNSPTSVDDISIIKERAAALERSQRAVMTV